MIFTKAYLLLAYFSPNVDRSDDTVTEAVKAAMVGLEPDIETEWKNFEMIVLETVDGPVTSEEYVALLAPLKELAPKMHNIITTLMKATPSEAAVERLFSRLKLSFSCLQSRALADTCNVSMQAVSAWKFFHFKEDKDECDDHTSPVKRNRTESIADSPNPSTPTQVDEQDESVDVDAEAAEFEVVPRVGEILRMTLAWHAERPEVVRPRPVGVRVSRSAADACHDCGRPLPKP
jgi:hypothetical protein